MGIFKIVVVMRTKDVGRNDTGKVTAVLLIVGPIDCQLICKYASLDWYRFWISIMRLAYA